VHLSANGLINIHDIRHLNEPAASLLVHPSGISSASFQAHSGLMSAVSVLNPALTPSSTATPTDPGRPRANWSIHRSAVSRPTLVTEETTTFSPQSEDVGQRGFKPYTSVHPLRPFLAVGYGRTCFLRGSGVGKGEDTDSGSYSFLKAQAKFVM